VEGKRFRVDTAGVDNVTACSAFSRAFGRIRFRRAAAAVCDIDRARDERNRSEKKPRLERRRRRGTIVNRSAVWHRTSPRFMVFGVWEKRRKRSRSSRRGRPNRNNYRVPRRSIRTRLCRALLPGQTISLSSLPSGVRAHLWRVASVRRRRYYHTPRWEGGRREKRRLRRTIQRGGMSSAATQSSLISSYRLTPRGLFPPAREPAESPRRAVNLIENMCASPVLGDVGQST